MLTEKSCRDDGLSWCQWSDIALFSVFSGAAFIGQRAYHTVSKIKLQYLPDAVLRNCAKVRSPNWGAGISIALTVRSVDRSLDPI